MSDNVDINPSAEAELKQHFKEESYKFTYNDGSEVRFNISDIVALLTSYVEDDNKNVELTYNVELISGLEIQVDENTYNELIEIKQWTNDDITN